MRHLLTREDFEKKLRRSGVTADTHVVLYGDQQQLVRRMGRMGVQRLRRQGPACSTAAMKLWEAKGCRSTPQHPICGLEIDAAERNDDLRARFTEVLDIAGPQAGEPRRYRSTTNIPAGVFRA